MPEYTMLILWIALLIAFIVVDAATVQLVTIWFAVGVDNTEGTGIVKVEGSTWTARSSDGSRIEKGSNITVDRIDGVKLMVSKH